LGNNPYSQKELTDLKLWSFIFHRVNVVVCIADPSAMPAYIGERMMPTGNEIN
jgi:hypothetical protein